MLITKNDKVKNLICKGPKYRESKALDFNSAKKNISESIYEISYLGNIIFLCKRNQSMKC